MLREKETYTVEPIKDTKIDVYDLVKYDTIYEQIEKAFPEVKSYKI